MRDKYLLLVAYQGDPELCFAKDPSLSIDEWEALALTEEYKVFLDNINKRFVAHLDTTLIAHQAKASMLLEDVYNGTQDIKYLKDISKHFTDLLKLTEPVVARLGSQIRHEEDLSSLKIVFVDKGGAVC